MLHTTEDQIIKVHTGDQGRLWYADGAAIPMSTGDVSGFLRSLTAREPLHVRLLGVRENAELIVKLYRQCCVPGLGGRVEVASPLVCNSGEELRNPQIALYRMRQCVLPASLGGWHKVTELDYTAYALAAYLSRDTGFDSQALRRLESHPAWHDLMFLTTLDYEAAARVLGFILDPRWFVDCLNPNRVAKLNNYLGLTYDTLKAVTGGRPKHTWRSREMRCHAVLRAWKGEGQPDAADFERPGSFLWRRWDHHGRGWRGDLAASKAFVCYLVRTWQHQLMTRHARWDFFIPEQLLRGYEIQAYKAHAQKRPIL